MQPGTQHREPDPLGGHGDADEEFNAWRALQEATDEDRAGLLADIVGHPTMATVEELDYLNPSMSDDAIRRHLDRLEDADVIAKHELEPGERRRDFPYQFYTVTDPARALFDHNDLFPVTPWQRQYQTVEKTPRIREVETMPRPPTA